MTSLHDGLTASERIRAARLDHRPEHDFWMTHPDDVDYLAPADRWCRVCGRPDREHVCTTCGRRADDPYRNPVAGEGCVDRVHDAFTDRRTGAVL